MLGVEDIEKQANARKTYLRSVSWSDRSPNKPNPVYPRAQPSGRNRGCLPPLQPLAISRRNVEEWPKAGSDDLGVWPQQPTTPGGRSGCGLGLKSSGGSSKNEVAVREFESNKDKLAFYEKECSRIVDHVYLGSEFVAKNREILRENGITHVLNCVGFGCPEYFKGDLVYKTLWLKDSPSEDITSILYDVFDYFEDVREQKGRVLVHCSQGVSRSTSLVIAYLMWREGKSYEDAFQYVKAARGVTNPNMGFACQLLQCQKRVHALPASPNSVLRMYRMAPHSPYDPLHLVPKLLSNPSEQGLDSRGAFVVHIPSSMYVWVGKQCSSVMSNNARVAAQQVVKYEKAQGLIMAINEGEEPSVFWDALRREEMVEPVDGRSCGMIMDCDVGIRYNHDYDQDFEIFQKAVAGGVVPPFKSSGSVSETCLPARQNGWSRLRMKFANGIMKEIVMSPTIDHPRTQCNLDQGQIPETLYVAEEPVSPTAHLLQMNPVHSSPKHGLPNAGSFSEGFDHYVRGSDLSFSSPSPLSSPDSSPFPYNNPTFNSKSPSLSPSTSDHSSPFTFSPSSSNWSDFSNLSSQPSPSGLEFSENLCTKYPALGEIDCSIQKATVESCLGAFSTMNNWKSMKFCSSCKGNSPSIAERRGSNPPTLKLLPIVESACVSRTLASSRSFSLPDLNDAITIKVDGKDRIYGEIIQVNRDVTMSDSDN